VWGLRVIDWVPVLLFLVASGVVAGLIGTAGGIMSLISYPALLLTGASAVDANIANLAAATVCWPFAALASRREMTAVGPHLRYGVPAATLGGSAGTTLLLATPGSAFDRVVPFMVAVATIALLCQPLISTRRSPRLEPAGYRWRGAGLVALISVYGGYFGAGAGIMLLTVSLTLFDPQMPHANALKNAFVGAAALASTTILIVVAEIPWAHTIAVAAGLAAGSLVGPVLVRRLPAAVIRSAAALLGAGLAIHLFTAAY
jgi:uncharacterized membrane protein YfcA